MPRRHTQVIAVVVTAVLAVAVALLINLITNDAELAGWVKKQPWYSPKLLGLALVGVVVFGIVVTLWQQRRARTSEGVAFAAEDLKGKRLQLIARVSYDVKRLLNQSLYKVARIDLGLEDRPDAVQDLVTFLIQDTENERRPIPRGTRISTLFEEHAQGMLILGAPGSGKSTLLLELARDLLERSKQDDSGLIPVVFFLSSWAIRRTSLEEWLADQLNRFYGVPRKLAEHWVRSDQVLPLLDGLDEVAAEHREACVEAINVFRGEHGILPVAVCSRLADYDALTQRLQLPGAVVIQPLTQSEISEYVRLTGGPLAGLQKAVESDPLLWELLDTPLMLSIAMLAYQDSGNLPAWETGSIEQRRNSLLARYVNAMFRRPRANRKCTPEQSLHWLRWLASSMVRLNQSVFHLEELSEEWLPTRAQRVSALWGKRLFVGLVFGLVFGLVNWLGELLVYGLVFGLVRGLVAGLIFGLVVGLVFGLIGERRVVDTLRWSWQGARSGLVPGLVVGLVVGLVWGLEVGLLGGLAPGLFSGLNYGLAAGAIPVRATPNQGTWRSGRNGLLSMVVFGLVFGLVGRLVHGLLVGRIPVQGAGLRLGLLYGLLVGLEKGVWFFLTHWGIRLILKFNGHAPLRCVSFLDYAADRLFLRRVGGGYIFVHRILMEHFASLQESSTVAEQSAMPAEGAGTSRHP
jgi:DNA polymerase III delta prime subunit